MVLFLQHQVLFRVSRDGIKWDVANSSMTENGTMTINGATITGGSIYQENDGRHLQLVNGNIHGGFTGSDNILYLAYRVDGHECIASKADGVCFESNRIYVRDGINGTVYEGYSGDVITGVTETDIIDGNGQTVRVLTGYSSRSATHGILR